MSDYETKLAAIYENCFGAIATYTPLTTIKKKAGEAYGKIYQLNVAHEFVEGDEFDHVLVYYIAEWLIKNRAVDVFALTNLDVKTLANAIGDQILDFYKKDVPRVYLVYRREDQLSEAMLESIYERLVQAFDAKHVFRDLDSIPLGVDFREHIASGMAHCDVCIPLIGPDWVAIMSQRGKEPQDFVRMEIEEALRRNIPVIPLYINNTKPPMEDELPPSIRALARRNGAEISSGPSFATQMEGLVKGLRRLKREYSPNSIKVLKNE
jgi:hypothetical protein